MLIIVSAKLATILAGMYAGLAEGAAVYSVVEIGPNLLAAVTSIVGAVVLIAQLLIARRLTRAESRVDVAETAAQEVGHLAHHAAERVTEVERKVENGEGAG